MLYTENTDMNVYHLFPTLCSFSINGLVLEKKNWLMLGIL